MRLLLLSDTHGDLAIIDRLAEQSRADAVLHAGDFGFYDRESVERLSTRELRLRILHSHLPEDVRKRAHQMDRQALREIIDSEAQLSQLPGYLDGVRTFTVPIHAVWGNHEDRSVIERFLDGTYTVENLDLVAPGPPHHIGPFVVYGLGGNLLPGRKILDRPIAGSGGKVWTTLVEIGAILEAHSQRQSEEGEIRILLSHVSPGKEPLIGRLAAFLDAHFLVSGHMGTPYCAVWNQFTIRDVDESKAWMDRDSSRIREAWEKHSQHLRDSEVRRLAKHGLSLLEPIPGEPVRRSRGVVEPPWFRKGFAVSLPDAEQGHAILILRDDGRVSLETHSVGLMR